MTKAIGVLLGDRPHGSRRAREFVSRPNLQRVNGEWLQLVHEPITSGADIVVRALGPNPPSGAEFVAWLRRTALDGGEGVCSPTAMGLTRGDWVRVRNKALQEAAQLLGADGCDNWALAGRLSVAVARFQSVRWPLIKLGTSVEDLGPVDQALCGAFRAGVGVIRSQKKLFEFLRLHGS